MTTNVRAFTLGFASVLAISVASFLALLNGFDDGFLFIWGSMLVGGFLTAVLATSHKLLLAAGLAIPAALSLALFNWAWGAYGYGSDFEGLGGSAIVLGFSLVIDAPLAFIGGLLGLFVSRRMTPNTSLERTRGR